VNRKSQERFERKIKHEARLILDDMIKGDKFPDYYYKVWRATESNGSIMLYFKDYEIKITQLAKKDLPQKELWKNYKDDPNDADRF